MIMKIKEFLQSQKKKRVETTIIEDFLKESYGEQVYWQNGGYETLVQAVSQLVEEDVLRPVKASKWNGKNPSLYNSYQWVAQPQKLDPLRKTKLLTYYHPEIQTKYYLHHINQYEKDEWYIQRMDRFLKQDSDVQSMTVNERSFQLFQDEKWLASPHGREVLGNLGLTWEKLRCYPTYEPFFYFRRVQISGNPKPKALIVENKDTFFSLKSLFQAGIYTWDSITFDLLIYGEGHKIEKSFAFFWELEEYRHHTVQFYYFGDLDPEGIAIWHRLGSIHDVPIEPFVYFYSELVQQHGQNAPPRPKNQRCSEEVKLAFLKHFSINIQQRIEEILNQNQYLPQEGLHIQCLRKLGMPNEEVEHRE